MNLYKIYKLSNQRLLSTIKQIPIFSADLLDILPHSLQLIVLPIRNLQVHYLLELLHFGRFVERNWGSVFQRTQNLEDVRL